MVQHKRPHVITNPSQVEHLGATRATNNTGELSAVCHALTGARELARPGEEVLILSDSQIAICTTTGAWASRKNKALVERNRRALAALRADGTTVRFQHVRAHAGHGMNERTDRLAAQGAQGMRSRSGRIYVPTDAPPETGAASTLRPAGRATSRWIQCRTEGRRWVGREGGGRGEDAWLRW